MKKLVIFMVMVSMVLSGCASIKYGTDVDYVMSLKNPIYVGTQVNGNNLMNDTGVIQSGLDIPLSFGADTIMLPWYLGLYWKYDNTELPYRKNQE